jgi:hypothetical protein
VYKKGLIKKGHDEAMRIMIMGSDMFKSTDPKMVELRSQVL